MTGVRVALDENVSHHLARYLRSLGHDADSAVELGRLGFHDPRVPLAAVDSGQTLVTHNLKDFTLLHQTWNLLRDRWTRETEVLTGHRVSFSGHFGILVLPHGAFEAAAGAMVVILDSGVPLAERLLRWSPNSGWHDVEG